MNGAQRNGWEAGTGGSLEPGQLNTLILGALGIVIFLFCAWALVTAYRGLATQAVTWRQFMEMIVRIILLILLTLFFFFH